MASDDSDTLGLYIGLGVGGAALLVAALTLFCLCRGRDKGRNESLGAAAAVADEEEGNLSGMQINAVILQENMTLQERCKRLEDELANSRAHAQQTIQKIGRLSGEDPFSALPMVRAATWKSRNTSVTDSESRTDNIEMMQRQTSVKRKRTIRPADPELTHTSKYLLGVGVSANTIQFDDLAEAEWEQRQTDDGESNAPPPALEETSAFEAEAVEMASSELSSREYGEARKASAVAKKGRAEELSARRQGDLRDGSGTLAEDELGELVVDDEGDAGMMPPPKKPPNDRQESIAVTHIDNTSPRGLTSSDSEPKLMLGGQAIGEEDEEGWGSSRPQLDGDEDDDYKWRMRRLRQKIRNGNKARSQQMSFRSMSFME